MADNLIFPIGFDLEAAVTKASKEWDTKYASKLEKAIQKRELEVKLKVSEAGLSSLEGVKRRLAELKIEPITPETKSAIRALAAELRELARALEAVKRYSARAGGTPEAVRNSKIEVNEGKIALLREQAREKAAKAALAEEKLAIAREKAATAATRGASATRSANKEFKAQDGYVQRLVKRLAVYASFRQISTFLTSVRDVTAEFELQRISLGAIIQDQARANQLFAEIKAFALKSPVKILDLTKYTKQLAAYKIGVDELFETTKRLTDISVGLGVSMDRIVLLYGQVRATGYLRASEVRQATEAGIPLVEELAKKLTQVNGQLVRSADVMDMISKREISFELVKEVFEDMTNAGGAFYNMQEKQGNTLAGMWAKLGDAASLMYEKIGNTDSVNKGMREAIKLLTELMRNWESTARVMAMTGGALLGKKVYSSLKKKVVAEQVAANAQYERASARYQAALRQEDAALKSGSAAAIQNARAKKAEATSTLLAAKAEKQAAMSANVFTRALKSMKTALVTTGWGALLVALSAVADKLMFGKNKAEEMKESLDELRNKTIGDTGKQQAGLVELANIAVSAADGSKIQQKALEDLAQSYGNVIPKEQLTLENLRRLKGDYSMLTDAVAAYNIEVAKQEGQSIIGESFSAQRKELKELMMEGQGFWKGLENFGGRFLGGVGNILSPIFGFDSAYGKAMKNLMEAPIIVDTFKDFGVTEDSMERFLTLMQMLDAQTGQTMGRFDLFNETLKQMYGEDYRASALYKSLYSNAKEAEDALIAYVDSLRQEKEEVEAFNKAMEQTMSGYQDYYGIVTKLKESLSEIGTQDGDIDKVVTNAAWITTNALSKLKETASTQISGLSQEIQDAFNQITAVTISTPEGIDLTALNELINALKAEENASPQLIKALEAITKAYADVVPDEHTIMWQKKFANVLKEVGDNAKMSDEQFKKLKGSMSSYMRKAGETGEEYSKRLKAKLAEVTNTLKDYAQSNAVAAASGMWWGKYTAEEIAALEAQKEALQKMIELVGDYSTPTKKTDTRLQTLNEIEQTLTKIYQKYDELRKKEGDTKALENIKTIYGDTLAYVNEIGKKFKLNFEMPTDFGSLQDYRKAILDVIETLKKSKVEGAQKAALELQTKIDTGNVDELAKEIERKIKEISDRVSRTKTAREFYDRILSQTGDVNLAADLTMSVYGTPGEDLNAQLAEQLRAMVEGTSVELPDFVLNADMSLNTKALKDWADANKGLLGGTYDEIIKMANEADKDMAKTIEGWIKATKKAETYGGKLAEVYRKTSMEIERIQTAMANKQIGTAAGTELIEGYRRKEAEEVAKLQYEAFKDSPMYVQMFGDLDHASTTMLENMKQRLTQMRGEWKNLDPTQLKELQSRLKEIDAQLTKRNPFKTMAKSLKEYNKLRTKGDAHGHKSGTGAEQELALLTEAYNKAEENLAKTMADKSSTEADKARAEALVNTTKRSKEEAAQLVDEWTNVEKAIGLSANQMMQMLNWGGDIARGIADISEAMGADEDDVKYWNDIADGLEKVSSGIQDIINAALSFNIVGFISSLITAVPKMFVGFTQLFSAGKIRRANKEIKRQQELIDELTYSYSRLENAIEKAFGGDYVRNFNQQEENLRAQAQAYLKQAQTERSKGKDADKDKLKEYENAYRETMDRIADMQGQIAAQMLGTDLTAAARDFAKAWLDAYKEFANTSDKMNEKFQELMENLVVEGALAAVMKRALEPMYNLIDNMKDEDFYSETFWKRVAELAKRGAENADAGAQTMMSFLEKAGISVRQLGGEVTGISREFASASEESINGLAAMYDTNNYYVSHLPTISDNVAAIRMMMSEGTAPSAVATAAEPIDSVALWNQHLELQQGIYRHTAATAEYCERIAGYCERLSSDVHQVVGAKGSAGSQGVRVWLN